MAELPVRCTPTSLTSATGLDFGALQAALRAFVRARHPEPPFEPHEGPAQEEVVITAITRSRGRDRKVVFTYWQNLHPRSRYDKSKQAEGWLRLGPDGAVKQGELGSLEFCTLG